jgi:hypothetical protein
MSNVSMPGLAKMRQPVDVEVCLTMFPAHTEKSEEFIDVDWAARCAAPVRRPRSAWRDVPDDEAGALTEACMPGFELLRGATNEYDS